METKISEKPKKDLAKEHELFELLTGKKLLEPDSKFDIKFGLKYPKSYVNAVKGAIAVFPKDIVVTFVQKFSKSLVDGQNEDALKYFIDRLRHTNYSNWTSADLGMLAYIIRQYKKGEIKRMALELYSDYDLLYLGNRILQITEEIEKEKNYL